MNKTEIRTTEEIFEKHLKKYGWDSTAKMCKADCMAAMEEYKGQFLSQLPKEEIDIEKLLKKHLKDNVIASNKLSLIGLVGEAISVSPKQLTVVSDQRLKIENFLFNYDIVIEREVNEFIDFFHSLLSTNTETKK